MRGLTLFKAHENTPRTQEDLVVLSGVSKRVGALRIERAKDFPSMILHHG